MSATCQPCKPKLVCSDTDDLFTYNLLTATPRGIAGCACKPLTACGRGGIDLLNGYWIYATQGFTFVLTCPTGYSCNQPVIIINTPVPPPIHVIVGDGTPTGFTLSLQSPCPDGGMLTRVVPA